MAHKKPEAVPRSMSARVSVGAGLIFQYVFDIAESVELWSLSDIYSIPCPLYVMGVVLTRLCITVVDKRDFLCFATFLSATARVTRTCCSHCQT